MMKIRKLLALPLLALLAAAGSATAGTPAPKAPISPVVEEDDSLGFSLAAGYDSSYIFRGVKYGDHLVWTSLTVPIKLTDKLTFTFAPWYGNIADGEYDELDVVAGFTYDLGFATVGVGYTWYYYPFSGFDTSEPNVTIQSCLCELGTCKINWFAGAFLDVNADGGDLFGNAGGDPGWYFETGLNTSIAITDWLSIVPEARITYGVDYYGVDGFNNVLLKLGAPITLTKTATLTPYIAGSLAIDSLHHDLGVDDELFGGISLTVTF